MENYRRDPHRSGWNPVQFAATLRALEAMEGPSAHKLRRSYRQRRDNPSAGALFWGVTAVGLFAVATWLWLVFMIPALRRDQSYLAPYEHPTIRATPQTSDRIEAAQPSYDRERQLLKREPVPIRHQLIYSKAAVQRLGLKCIGGLAYEVHTINGVVNASSTNARCQ
jgi:hypothetical protein